MAISISSCLRPPSSSSSPPPPRPSPSNKTPLTPWPASKEASWGSRCVATAACIIIGSSAAGFAGGDGRRVPAGDHLKVMEVSEGKVARWSDRRRCPPWHVNSLENIMPENLPRPSTGRRSNGLVAYKRAPPVGGASFQYKSSCYSL
ncbi:uncharacterized protein LOC103721053 [Phoenix dactylifera]|uniref:Uncharacterized protein LOC103721053 n=1 Tax=Phoenix dactylifera TaxID=42345 RepID=A0A8B7CZ74_PHODC|nr:uncharacterized protein LOC103721053 [Phoenix dactylifera]